MRVSIVLILLGGIFPPTLFAQDSQSTTKPIKLMGDETTLVHVKADPQSYVGKQLIMTGGIQVSDYYNYGYMDEKDLYYSFDFREAVTPTKLGESCHLYLRRQNGKTISDTIVAKLATEGSAKMVRVRVKAAFDPEHFEGDGQKQWDMMELLDVQFSAPEGNDWKPWTLESQRQAAAETAMRVKQDALDEKREKEKVREQERAALTRSWTDTSGKFSVTAEYSGTAGDKVLLKKENGEVVKIPLDKLSELDRKWLEDRRKKTTSPAQAVHSP
jgi:hypothetical protein